MAPVEPDSARRMLSGSFLQEDRSRRHLPYQVARGINRRSSSAASSNSSSPSWTGLCLTSDRTISPRTKQAVKELRSLGIVFVIISGRPPRGMVPVSLSLSRSSLPWPGFNGGAFIEPDLSLLVRHVIALGAGGSDSCRVPSQMNRHMGLCRIGMVCPRSRPAPCGSGDGRRYVLPDGSPDFAGSQRVVKIVAVTTMPRHWTVWRPSG